MRSVNGRTISLSCTGADSKMSPSGNNKFSFLIEKPICVHHDYLEMLSNVLVSTCLSGLTHMRKALAEIHTHTNTHTPVLCPLMLPIVRLSSSCFSTHPHCCHSGQEAVGEIRMTKSLFIKLAKSVCSAFGVLACVCFRDRERMIDREWEREH